MDVNFHKRSKRKPVHEKSSTQPQTKPLKIQKRADGENNEEDDLQFEDILERIKRRIRTREKVSEEEKAKDERFLIKRVFGEEDDMWDKLFCEMSQTLGEMHSSEESDEEVSDL
jgi:hypothetical protein